MSVMFTEQEFLGTINSGKREPQVLQPNADHQQLIVGWYVKGTQLMVKVYSSVYGPSGQGESRGTGKDSIRICLVDLENNRGVGRVSYTQRTVGWQRRLKEKVRDMFKRAYLEIEVRNENPSCPLCNSSMHLRQARKGKHKGNLFYGCSSFPDCTGTKPPSPALEALEKFV